VVRPEGRFAAAIPRASNDVTRSGTAEAIPGPTPSWQARSGDPALTWGLFSPFRPAPSAGCCRTRLGRSCRTAIGSLRGSLDTRSGGLRHDLPGAVAA